WTASTDYSSDMPISEEILSRVTDSYRRIRNTIRFMLGNTYDFEEDKNAVPYEGMEEIDRWMLSRLQNLVKRVTSLMDRYLYHQAVQALHLFCTVDMSSLYMDILKDRLYTFPADSAERRSAQTSMSRILGELVVMIAPVLPHTAEEAWISMSEGRGQTESVHLAPWPEYDESLVDAGLEEKWAGILEIREDVYRKMEEARRDNFLGTSLEALVRIYARGTSLELLESMKPQLPAIFIVSQAEVHDLSEYTEERQDSGDVEVIIERAEGSKCERCWNYTPAVGQDNDNPDICERCAAALAEE
ncbi:MAG: class I tRNA ligase family protein, partial [Actinobacteria bacterium]|nr:class I tRNA ligase family protein [Actinomycetota bacterium]